MNNSYKFNIKRERPEDIFENPIDYYTKDTLVQYATSKNIMRIQEKITRRALELLNIEIKNSLILDAGCGPGFILRRRP